MNADATTKPASPRPKRRASTAAISCRPAWKTTVPSKPGSLHHALGAFAMFDLDLAKVESRPIEGRPWEYAFYVDIIGRESEPDVTRALDNLRHMAEMVKVLGSYPTKW